eukprot:CAMPEP_0202104544 /NCGR_PEP_ID=MMETSP0965-20130614/5521_1 /ASSEMBLY_ACC=CAM_ASM_000507 /TAXON_ID=4773 /ORGANISM="Schizochytrium aggregatum, Strain ATCC28209" /LENGTH=192 /DNA_ID=CAMNT_0048673407 /DNA_START=541 /DNA_END=1116 /DNA_ORIENTATION=-
MGRQRVERFEEERKEWKTSINPGSDGNNLLPKLSKLLLHSLALLLKSVLELEAVEVVHCGVALLLGDALALRLLLELVKDVILLESLLDRLDGGVNSNVDLEVGEGDPLDVDHVAGDASEAVRAVHEDAVDINDVDDHAQLVDILAVVDHADAANLHELGEHHLLLLRTRDLHLCCLPPLLASCAQLVDILA